MYFRSASWKEIQKEDDSHTPQIFMPTEIMITLYNICIFGRHRGRRFKTRGRGRRLPACKRRGRVADMGSVPATPSPSQVSVHVPVCPHARVSTCPMECPVPQGQGGVTSRVSPCPHVPMPRVSPCPHAPMPPCPHAPMPP